MIVTLWLILEKVFIFQNIIDQLEDYIWQNYSYSNFASNS